MRIFTTLPIYELGRCVRDSNSPSFLRGISMSRYLFSTLVLLGAVLDSADCGAAVVNVAGTVQPGSSMHGGAGPGSAFAFAVTFNAVGEGGVVGTITAATFSVAGQTYSLLGTGTASISDNGAAGDLLNFNVNLNPSNPGGFAGGSLSLSLFSNPLDNSIVSDSMLTSANIDAFKNNANTGNFLWQPGGGAVLLGVGTASVPEPSSVIMVAGIGMFFAGGAIRRRKKQLALKSESAAI